MATSPHSDASTASIIAQAAAAATAGQRHPPASLYVVATPIGNLADLTLRAVRVLGFVDAVACEDTRLSGALLARLGLHKPLIAVHEHNERAAAEAVLQRLARGERVAYVSDAGTPAVSDPGAALVASATAAGYRCIPIPGASSVVAALSVAGDAQAAGFVFGGFLPAKARERDAALAAIGAHGDASIVLFEAPHRIVALAEALAAVMPQRRVTLARELTKQFETVATLQTRDLPAWLAAEANRTRGEFVLVLHAQPAVRDAEALLDAAACRTLDVLLAELPLKQAVSLAAALSGAPRNALYERALARRGGT